MAPQDWLSFRCRVCIPLTGSKILNLFTKLESSKTHESVYTHKSPGSIFTHTHTSTLRVKVIGCSGNFSGQSQVGGKLVGSFSSECLFWSDISPCTARCRWCHAEVVLCHLLLCVRFRHVEPFSVVACSSFFFVRSEGRQLAAIDNTALKSVFGSWEKMCAFSLFHDVLPWPGVEMVARGDKGLRKPNYITAVLQSPLHFPALLPLERSNFSSTFASREVRSPQTQSKP